MKKIVIITTFAAAPVASFAQNNLGATETFHIVATIFTIVLFMIFIVTILRHLLDYRLRNRILDKGIPESVAGSLLRTGANEAKYVPIKWFAILTGIGAGLTIIHYTQPLGIHSLAIMAFSLAVAFLGYYIFLRFSEKQEF